MRDGQPARSLRSLQKVVQRSARRDVGREVAAAVRVERIRERVRRGMRGPAPVQPRLGARGDLPPPILRVQSDLVERRAARRALQPADQLVQLSRPGMERFLRGLARQRASDRAVLPERGEAGQPLQAWKTLRATQGSVCLRVAKPGGELAGRGVAQQRLDARVQSPQRLQLPFPENDGGGLGKRAALVQRPRAGRPLRLTRQARQRRPALLEQRAERLQGGRAPPRSRDIAHLGEQAAHFARSLRQLGGGPLSLQARQDPVHSRQLAAQLAGARIRQRAMSCGSEAAERLLESLSDAEAQVAIALDHRVQARGGRAQQAARREQLGQRHHRRGDRPRRTARRSPAHGVQVVVAEPRVALPRALALVLGGAQPRALLRMHSAGGARPRKPGSGAVDGVLALAEDAHQLVAVGARERRNLVGQVAPGSGAIVEIGRDVESRGAALQMIETLLDRVELLAWDAAAQQVCSRPRQAPPQRGRGFEPGLQERAQAVPPPLLLDPPVERRDLQRGLHHRSMQRLRLRPARRLIRQGRPSCRPSGRRPR